MSKKRPSIAETQSPARENIQTKLESGYWRSRVFRNTFTSNGQVRQVRGWSVKIQYRGKRATFSLLSPQQEQAAHEALNLYKALLTRGWEATLNDYGAKRVLAGPLRPHETDRFAKSEVRYWEQRLIQRKYTEVLRQTSEHQFSVRIQHEGTSCYFPLGTSDASKAAAKALQIFRTVLAQGWPAVHASFAREITVAVFWSNNPLAYTYTTLFTLLNNEAARPFEEPGASNGNLAVAVVEADAGVRRAMRFWISQHKGFRCTAAYPTAKEALPGITRKRPDLVLVSNNLPETPAQPFLEKLKTQAPDLPIFHHGIYEDSDQVFYSFSGVSAGYIIRRRRPNEFLEPIAAATSPLSVAQANHLIRHYFQNFFSGSFRMEEASDMKFLTLREHQILDCVSKGFVDKEIASRLGISPWTVHGHLRHIYEKLRVHSRTEAVVKYLQK